MSGLIQPKMELDQAFMPVLVTSKFDDDSIKNEQTSMETPFSHYTRGIWKVLITIQYLSNRLTNQFMLGIILNRLTNQFMLGIILNRLTNQFMLGIILNSYLCSIVQNKSEMDGVWQAQDFSLSIHIMLWHWEMQIFNETDKILLFQKWCITFTLMVEIRFFSYIL